MTSDKDRSRRHGDHHADTDPLGAGPRWARIKELGESPEPVAAAELIDALTDPEQAIRTVAARTLAQRGDSVARRALVERLVETRSDDDVLVLAEALTKISIGIEDLPVLIEAFERTQSRVARAACFQAAASAPPEAIRQQALSRMRASVGRVEAVMLRRLVGNRAAGT